MFKLVLEKAEEPEIKLPTSTGSSKNQESSRKTSISALLTMPKPLTVWITTNWKILKEMGIPDHLTCLLRNLYAGQEATVKNGYGLLDSEGEGEGDGGMIWENGIETCILSFKKRITSLCPMQDTGCLGLVRGDDPERCYGEGGGRGVHVWEPM